MSKELIPIDWENELKDEEVVINDHQEMVDDFINICGFSEEDAENASKNVILHSLC